MLIKIICALIVYVAALIGIAIMAMLNKHAIKNIIPYCVYVSCVVLGYTILNCLIQIRR